MNLRITALSLVLFASVAHAGSLCRYPNPCPADETGEPQSHVVQRAKRVFGIDRSEIVHFCTSSAPSEETMKRVRALVGGYEDVPAARSVRAIGPELVDAVDQLVHSAKEPPSIRARSVDLLALARGSKATLDLLQRIVNERATLPPACTRSALLALGWAHPASAVPIVAPFLADTDVQMRRIAVRALENVRRRGNPAARTQARSRLEKARAEEKAPIVRRAIDHALRAPKRAVKAKKKG